MVIAGGALHQVGEALLVPHGQRASAKGVEQERHGRVVEAPNIDWQAKFA